MLLPPSWRKNSLLPSLRCTLLVHCCVFISGSLFMQYFYFFFYFNLWGVYGPRCSSYRHHRQSDCEYSSFLVGDPQLCPRSLELRKIAVMWKSTWSWLQILLTISITYTQAGLEKWGLLALPTPPWSSHLHPLSWAITTPLMCFFMSLSNSKSGPDRLLLSRLVARSQIHTNTSPRGQNQPAPSSSSSSSALPPSTANREAVGHCCCCC